MKKFLPYILILLIMIGGFFSTTTQISAQAAITAVSISGVTKMGEVLTANVTPSTMGQNIVDYQWQRGSAGDGAFAQPSYTNIGASTPTYTLQSADVPYSIRVIVTGKNGLTGTMTSDPTATITSGLPPVVPLVGTQNSTATDTNYTPLAPLPGLMNPDGTAKPINTATDCAFGKYLNIMIELVIGLITIGAFVMITMGGIEYMTSELISSKEHGKERIRNAILGILLALGAYTILYTINPKLLDVCLKLDTVTITIDSESESAPWTGVAQLTGPTTNCIEGYTDVSTQGGQPSTINVCKSLSSNLTRMISAAKSNSLILSGWGSRTYAQQVTLRQQHGCPDIYNSPSTACTPQTARPGHSKHESGKAVDFTCNGAEMAGSSCFNWLKTNAGTYGFKNLASEPWHWSDDGR